MLGHRQMTTEDYKDILRRRRWFIIIPFVLGPLLALGVSFLLHNIYKSQALILIQQQRVPDNFVQPVVTEDLNARLATMQEQILSRTRLQPIIEKYGLFKRYAKSESMEKLVQRLRDAITLTVTQPMVSSARSSRDQTLPGFYVDVSLDGPRTAQQVCADITSMFVEENLRQREKAAQGTTNFMQGQLDDAKRGLDAQDSRLAAFKRKYFGMLPDEMKTNLNLLQALNTQLEAVTQSLSRAQQDKTYAQTMLDQQVAAWKQSQAQAQTAGQSGEVPKQTLEQQLAKLQERLAALQTVYTDQYPDVVRLKDLIAKLKKKVQAKNAAPQAASEPKAAANSAPEPTPILQLRSQVHADEEAIRTYSGEQSRIRKQINVYEGRLQLSPTVEQQYKEITRDHDTALKIYNSLLQKRDESAMATDLERAQQGEQFQIMDPANLPQQPDFPNRWKFAGGGLGGGLALGLALALLLEMLDKSLRTEADVELFLGASPLAKIPLVEVTGNGKKHLAGVKKGNHGRHVSLGG